MKRRLAWGWLALGLALGARVDACEGPGLHLQVLGSGGAELAGARAGSGFLLWRDGRARVLIDAGPGTALRFRESGARFADLDAVLFTQLHADHSADITALIDYGQSQGRQRPLSLYGPSGNRYMPSTVGLVRSLFDPVRGAYRHLGDLISPQTALTYKLRPLNVLEKPVPSPTIALAADLQATAMPLRKGRAPVLVWRVAHGSQVAVLGPSRVMAGTFAQDADILAVSLPAPENTEQLARLVKTANTKHVLLTQRRTPGSDTETRIAARIRHDAGVRATLAEDLACHAL